MKKFRSNIFLQRIVKLFSFPKKIGRSTSDVFASSMADKRDLVHITERSRNYTSITLNLSN